MKWFRTVFLPSLEERYNKSKGNIWLTRKQTDVCRNYMEFGTIKGHMYIDIDNKRYSIQIAPNGCSSFCILVDGWIVESTENF